jgi:hypothetical protein
VKAKLLSIGGQSDNTTAPVSVAQASATQDPEFLDAAGLQSRFGIKRSLAYVLLADGAIRGVSLRRGIRREASDFFASIQCASI